MSRDPKSQKTMAKNCPQNRFKIRVSLGNHVLLSRYFQIFVCGEIVAGPHSCTKAEVSRHLSPSGVDMHVGTRSPSTHTNQRLRQYRVNINRTALIRIIAIRQTTMGNTYGPVVSDREPFHWAFLIDNS